MRVLVLGGDGYLGWPTAMYFSNRGHSVSVVDNLSKRSWEQELGVVPLIPIQDLPRRVSMWKHITGHSIRWYNGDITNYEFVDSVVSRELPDAVIHYGEQPSAPYSMRDYEHAKFTQVNNVVGTLAVMFSVFARSKDTHIIKLGTMGEYGTPNIDIEEGYLVIEHNGRSDVLPYPKQPPSFYHLSKVHDSHNLQFGSRIWGLRVTDLNQGIVYGVSTPESRKHPDLATSFHYDETFGTVINRFMTQALCGYPLTVYGKGRQRRGFLNILDTLQCVELAVRNPAEVGQCRVFNQFTEQFSVGDLARMVKSASERRGRQVEIRNVENPRVESEDHYYNAKHTALLDLGLKPHYLTEDELVNMMDEIQPYVDRVNRGIIMPTTRWVGGASEPTLQK